MAIGDSITAQRYNDIQTTVASVLGNGSGDRGYGQTPLSVPVTQNVDVVEAADMNALYTDMEAILQHQTNASPTTISQVTADVDLVTDDNTGDATKGYADYEALANQLDLDRFELASTGQSSIANIVTTANAPINATRTTAWNGTIVHKFTCNFNSADHFRHFFNSGGQIRIFADITGGTGKQDDWDTMLFNAGDVIFDYEKTVSSKSSGTANAIGAYDLTVGGAYSLIYRKVGSGVYAENDYLVFVKRNSNTQLQFLVEFQDDDVGDDNNNDGATNPIDENVQPTLATTITARRASGSFVSVAAPTGSNLITLAADNEASPTP